MVTRKRKFDGECRSWKAETNYDPKTITRAVFIVRRFTTVVLFLIVVSVVVAAAGGMVMVGFLVRTGALAQFLFVSRIRTYLPNRWFTMVTVVSACDYSWAVRRGPRKEHVSSPENEGDSWINLYYYCSMVVNSVWKLWLVHPEELYSVVYSSVTNSRIE